MSTLAGEAGTSGYVNGTNSDARFAFPTGLAIDPDGNLYVAASLRGRRGVVRISPDARKAELLVAGMNVVGLAFGPGGDMIVATNESIYRLELGIKGLLLS